MHMKKIISLVSAIAMIASVGTANVTANAEETYLKGDFNGDGVVDYNDAFDFQHAYAVVITKRPNFEEKDIDAHRAELTKIIKDENKIDDAKAESLDLNKDGYLDTRDVVYILEYDADKHFGYTGDFDIDAVDEYYKTIDTNRAAAYRKAIEIAYDKAHPVEVVPEPDPEPSLGDVNGDKQIDSKDAVAVLKYYAASLTSEESKVENYQWIAEYGDYNKDGAVDAKDAVAIICEYAALIMGE